MAGYSNLFQTDGNSEWNEQVFQVKQFLKQVNTALPVRVLAVRNTGLAPVGYVDIVPLVKQENTNGDNFDNPKIHNVPYFRLQGGPNAVVIDPEIGDMGIAVFSQRDIGNVKNQRGEAGPGSMRVHALGDALYIGGVLNAAPVQYIFFNPGGNGITVVSPVSVSVQAPAVSVQCDNASVNASANVSIGAGGTVSVNAQNFTVNAATSITGGAAIDGATIGGATIGGISFNGHVHTGNMGFDTSPPTRG